MEAARVLRRPRVGAAHGGDSLGPLSLSLLERSLRVARLPLRRPAILHGGITRVDRAFNLSLGAPRGGFRCDGPRDGGGGRRLHRLGLLLRRFSRGAGFFDVRVRACIRRLDQLRLGPELGGAPFELDLGGERPSLGIRDSRLRLGNREPASLLHGLDVSLGFGDRHADLCLDSLVRALSLGLSLLLGGRDVFRGFDLGQGDRRGGELGGLRRRRHLSLDDPRLRRRERLRGVLLHLLEAGFRESHGIVRVAFDGCRAGLSRGGGGVGFLGGSVGDARDGSRIVGHLGGFLSAFTRDGSLLNLRFSPREFLRGLLAEFVHHRLRDFDGALRRVGSSLGVGDFHKRFFNSRLLSLIRASLGGGDGLVRRRLRRALSLRRPDLRGIRRGACDFRHLLRILRAGVGLLDLDRRGRHRGR